MQLSGRMSDSSTGRPDANAPLPEFVDWLVAAAIVLGGLLSLLLGSMLGTVFDRETLEEEIDASDLQGTIGSTELTQAETVEVADAIVSWLGLGLLVTGVVLVLFAIGFVVVRHRAHKRAKAGEPIRSYGAFATLGAVAAIVLSFIPFSSILGAGIAGYFEQKEGGRTISVGAVSALLPVVPTLVLLTFLFAGIYDGLSTIGEAGAAIPLIVVIVFVGVVGAVLSAVLGGLGGWVGGWIADR